MQTKLIEVQARTATVYFLGDIHEGAANHQAKALAKAIDIIANDSNAYWIGMGDYIDAINHRDPRFNPLEMAQKARAVIWNWLDAIVDVLAGNVAFLVIYLCIIK